MKMMALQRLHTSAIGKSSISILTCCLDNTPNETAKVLGVLSTSSGVNIGSIMDVNLDFSDFEVLTTSLLFQQTSHSSERDMIVTGALMNST